MSGQFPKVKICCISSVDEAYLAVRYGASALGLVSRMPSGPGVIKEELIREIVRALPPFVTSVLLTSIQDAEGIIRQYRRIRSNAIQIVDWLKKGSLLDIREALTGIRLIQVIHVRDEGSLEEAVQVAPLVDGILLDSGNQYLRVKELGGTGKTHDWSISRKIRDSIKVPVILAGGLNPKNVTEAIRQVEPYAVDVCGGVRTHGRLDEAKLSNFMEKVRKAHIDFQ